MTTILFTAFYTIGTRYEREADRLRRSLDRLGLEHDLQPVESRGDWIANTKFTATHVCRMLAKYPDRPVVQLDADAVVWKRPTLFDTFPEMGVDFAAHWRRGHEMLNGTCYFAPTAGAKLIAQRYYDLIRAHPGCTNEQTMLAVAVNESKDRANIFRMGPEMCWIHDIMANDLADGVDPVIEHLQASRDEHVTHLTDNRKRRLAELVTLGVELP